MAARINRLMGLSMPDYRTMRNRSRLSSAKAHGRIQMDPPPDFQRETTEWDPQRVVGLIQTFIEGDLVPAVILWQNKELLFVIDGSHRLSALTAWVHNDYGDGQLS